MATEVTSLGCAHRSLAPARGPAFEHGRQARLAAAVPADAQRLGHARNPQARSRRGDGSRAGRARASAARTIRTPRSCRISSSRRDPFTVISTGTWVIIMAVGGKARLDPQADMLANVDVRGAAGADRALHGRPRIRGPRRRSAGAMRTRPMSPAIVASGALALARLLRPGRPVRRAHRPASKARADDAESARGAGDALCRR